MTAIPVQPDPTRPAIEIDVLEYGKFCSSHDGSIEALAEYRVLGQSKDFPDELAKMCTPEQLGLAVNQVELERYSLLTARASGTVIRPVPAGSSIYYVCYRIEQRSEGGSRKYTVARYLCAKDLINPLALYRSMHPLEGLTRENAAGLKATSIIWNGMPDADRFSTEIVDRVWAGLRLKRPVFAVLDDESAFFRLAGSVWETLNRSQRGLFSCGWNVSPNVGKSLVLVFGPVIPDTAARLDLGKPPAPVLKAVASTSVRRYSSITGLMEAGRNLLVGNRKPVAMPLEGFDDPTFAEIFSGHQFEEDLILWLPDILQDSADSNRKYSKPQASEHEVVEHLCRLDPSLQLSLYDHLEVRILGKPDCIRAFAYIEQQCQQKNPEWGRGGSAALRLTLRFQMAFDSGTLGDLLVDLDASELIGIDGLNDSFLPALSKALQSLNEEQAVLVHGKLLLASPPWYTNWVKREYRDLVFLLLRNSESGALSRILELLPDVSTVEIANKIVSRIQPQTVEHDLIARLDPESRAKFAGIIYNFWLHDEPDILPWMFCFPSDLPPSLPKHCLDSWKGEAKNIREDVRKEFANQGPSQRRRLVRTLRSLCDGDDLPEALGDAFWAEYLSEDIDCVSAATKDWQTPKSFRFRLQYALFEKKANDAVLWLLATASEAGLTTIPEEGTPGIGPVFDRLIGDPELFDSIAELIKAWPRSSSLADWIENRGLRIGAWLLQCESRPEGVLEKVIDLSAPRDAKLLAGIKDFVPGVEEFPREESMDGQALEWLARFIEYHWRGTQNPGWQIVAAWARWIGGNSFQDPVLRLLVGLEFDADKITSQSEWQALEVATNVNIPVHLALVRCILTGTFEVDEPSDHDITVAVEIVRQELALDDRGRWDDLWKASKLPWQRLFVLASAFDRGFEISMTDAAELRTELNRLRRTLSDRINSSGWRSTASVDKHPQMPDPAITNARLSLAVEDFQSLAFDSSRWTDEIRGTPLMGVFRRVPLEFYTVPLFRRVVELYFPSLQSRTCSGDIGSALLEFANAFGTETSDYRRALDLIHGGFFRPHVCSSLVAFGQLGTIPAIVETAIYTLVRTERKSFRKAISVLSSPYRAEWVDDVEHFICLQQNRILLDSRLRNLFVLMSDLDERRSKGE